MKMPVLFLGHGSPMNIAEENKWTRKWRELGREYENIRGVVMVSAHWFGHQIHITEEQWPETVHDMYGFPDEIYIDYEAENKLENRDIILEKLIDIAQLSSKWGYDHGCYSILHHMYPDRDKPVTQVSINLNGDSNYHFQIGEKLRELRNEGFLIIGSGNIVHNLRKINFTGNGYEWAEKFNRDIISLVNEFKIKEILELEKTNKFYPLAVPTIEHYMPFIVTLGCLDKNDKVEVFNNDIVGASLSMVSFLWS